MRRLGHKQISTRRASACARATMSGCFCERASDAGLAGVLENIPDTMKMVNIEKIWKMGSMVGHRSMFMVILTMASHSIILLHFG